MVMAARFFAAIAREEDSMRTRESRRSREGNPWHPRDSYQSKEVARRKVGASKPPVKALSQFFRTSVDRFTVDSPPGASHPPRLSSRGEVSRGRAKSSSGFWRANRT